MATKYNLSISYSINQKNYAHLMGNFIERVGMKVDYDEIKKPHIVDMEFDEYISRVSLSKSKFSIILFSKEYHDKIWESPDEYQINIGSFSSFSNNCIIIYFDEFSMALFEGYPNLFPSDPEPITHAKIYLSKIKKSQDDHSIYSFLYVDDIDSFSKIREITPSDLEVTIPLNLLEDDFINSICEIIEELCPQAHWGGETSDIFSDIIFNGHRVPVAFLCKGRGLAQRLTIASLGTHGDQVLRLMREKAIIYIVQHVNFIDPNVRYHVALYVESTARQRREKLYYCIMDGVDVARLFTAYEKPLESP